MNIEMIVTAAAIDTKAMSTDRLKQYLLPRNSQRAFLGVCYVMLDWSAWFWALSEFAQG